MTDIKMSKIVESICSEGCISVNNIIDALEQGDLIKQVDSLTASERIQLIKELKEIMSVYNKK